MAFFLPTNIQKRLLRYALSRVQLFDTDALDLDSLDIGLGRRSNIELRDVALRKTELSKLLQLPSSLSIHTAGVSSLRLSIPADVYSRPISVEVRGIKVTLQLSDASDTALKKQERDRQDAKRREPASNLAATAGAAHQEPVIPSPEDLAKSFLQHEPPAQAAELEAELLSQSVDLQQSVASTTAEDSSAGYGTGGETSVPGFLAGFLTGVVDRLELSIQDVQIQLAMNLDPPSSCAAGRPFETIPVTVTNTVSKLEVQGVTNDPSVKKSAASEAHDSSEQSLGKRLIALHGISVSVSGKLEHLALWSRTDAESKDSSNILTNLQGAIDPFEVAREDTHNLARRRNESLKNSGAPTYADLGSSPHPNTNLDASQSTNLIDSVHLADVNNFDEMSADEGSQRRSADNVRQREIRAFGREDRDVHETLQSFRKERGPLSPKRLSRRSSPSSTERSQRFGVDDESLHESMYMDPEMTKTTFGTPLRQVSEEATPAQEMTESKFFSHDEAASIYMSVMSEDVNQPEREQAPPLMPGTWDIDSRGFAPRVHYTATGEQRSTKRRTDSDPLDSHVRSFSAQQRLFESGANQPGAKDTTAGASKSAAWHEYSKQPQREPYTEKGHDAEFATTKLLDISFVQAWLPGLANTPSEHSANDPTIYEPAQSTSHGKPASKEPSHMPGSFSVYAESALMARSRVDVPDAGLRHTATTIRERTRDSQRAMDFDMQIGEVSSVVTMSDLSLLIQLAKRLKESFIDNRPHASSKAGHKSRQDASTAQELHIRTKLEQIKLVLRSAGSMQDAASPLSHSFDAKKDILSIVLAGLKLDLQAFEKATEAVCNTQKFEINVGDQRAVHFDRSAQMSSSVRDTQILNEHDIAVSYSQRNDVTQVDVKTLPLVLSADATKLDDAASSFGGFSALLDMGSSMISEATLEPASPSKSINRPRVRFEQHRPLQSAVEEQKASLKMNVRVNGSSMTLKAGSRTFRSSTTAIKAVVRDAALGIQIDDARLSGPHILGRTDNPVITLRARNASFRYLARPEEHDLTRLISLVTPSKDNFERGDGGILVETLVRQRKNGAAARLSLSKIDVHISDMQTLNETQLFANDLTRLAAITKYLPEETRPGLLFLVQVEKIQVAAEKVSMIGTISLDMSNLELANVSAPSLLALKVQSVAAQRGGKQNVLHPAMQLKMSEHESMLMVRLVGEELVPVLEVKLMNACLEYDVAMVMDMLGIRDSPHGVDALAASVMFEVKGHGHNQARKTHYASTKNDISSSSTTGFRIDLGLRNCTIGLTPRRLPSKGLVVLSNARLQLSDLSTDIMTVAVDIRKAALLLTDERTSLKDDLNAEEDMMLKIGQQIPHLCKQGYVSMCWASAARANASIQRSADANLIDLEFDDELFVLESCADSTKTLSELLSDLQPPAPPVPGKKYRTEVATVEDMMASFVGQSIPAPSQQRSSQSESVSLDESDTYEQYLDQDDLLQALSEEQSEDGSQHSSISDLQQATELGNQNNHSSGGDQYLWSQEIGGLDPTSLPQKPHATAAKWDSDRNKYVSVSQSEVLSCPFKLQVKNIHIIWNLHDGYDWQKTRDTISKAVSDIEAKSEEKRHRQRQRYEPEQEPEPVIGDFLFNSIYVGVPIDHNPGELTRQINRNVDDLISETASHATTSTATDATPRATRPSKPRKRPLRLERSQRHKLTFELSGVALDMFIYPPGEETVSSTDIRVHDFDIFDHVPTSTWKKFMTYMHDAGPREDRKPMMHIEICNVKPIPDLLASELVMRVTVLPVRLHVDQDALDFMTRFFAFESGEGPDNDTSGDQPYIQRVEVLPVPLKLDYKPKKVDYAGLRSGRTKEFMNFFNLDGADMVLKHAIIYGCPSFARMHTSLEDIWMPDITTKQLPGVLSGLNGIRTLVNVGGGVRNLVTIPIQEYRKDGRIVRSISKGALSFARTSGSELTKFGAKLAIGAQTALQGAEDFLVKDRRARDADWETADLNDEEKRAFSHYADQPIGILQGLKGAAKSLERDLLLTRDVVVAISGEARESGSIDGAALAVARHAPTIILRPMIGASKAVSQTLMGATNTVDPQERRRLEDKYKRY